MLSEEEMRAIDFLKGVCTDDCVNKEFVVKPILYLIEKQQKELDNLKEIEQSHKEENGKLRVELEQEKNKINIIKKLMAVGDVTDEALFTLVQTTMAELERLEDIEEQLDKEKEKNKSLKKQIKEMQEYYKNADFIFKDKIKERMEQTKKVYDEEMKPYMIEVGNGEKVLNVTYLSKKEKEELINKRNCLLVQIKTYEDLLEEK